MHALLPGDGTDPLVRPADAPKPAPRAAEAVVAVEAFSPNRGELLLLERPRPGWRPGKDIAGRVVRAAADGTGPAAGARVVGHPPAAGWAQLAAVPTRALAVLPTGVEATTAAALPLAGLTALRLLRAAGPIAGRRVLLTGASGGVGHYVTELASAVGAEVIAVSRRPERLLALGAAAVVPRPDRGDDPALPPRGLRNAAPHGARHPRPAGRRRPPAPRDRPDRRLGAHRRGAQLRERRVRGNAVLQIPPSQGALT